MPTSEIKLKVVLDNQNVPESIVWDASDKNPQGYEKTKAFCLSIWDHAQQNTLKIDLWSKDMPLDEMKRFYIESIGGLAQSLKTATGDEVMFEEIHTLCERLGKHLENETKKAQ